MATFLFEDIIFGPVNSRRLGVSLGINLVPVNRKVCTFNCIYCECGWTSDRHLPSDGFPSRELIAESLRKKVAELRNGGILPDALTYAGNGEPALLELYWEISPDEVQVYTTARDTPISTLNKVPLSDLESIAAKIKELGIKNSVFP